MLKCRFVNFLVVCVCADRTSCFLVSMKITESSERENTGVKSEMRGDFMSVVARLR